MFDAPEIGRDDVSDIFNKFMNVLQINNINTSTKNTYKYRDYLSSGDQGTIGKALWWIEGGGKGALLEQMRMRN